MWLSCSLQISLWKFDRDMVILHWKEDFAPNAEIFYLFGVSYQLIFWNMVPEYWFRIHSHHVIWHSLSSVTNYSGLFHSLFFRRQIQAKKILFMFAKELEVSSNSCHQGEFSMWFSWVISSLLICNNCLLVSSSGYRMK